MNFESLPNELFLTLFEYLTVVDLFRAFVGLNTRFNTLLFEKFHKHRLDFRSISKRDFDFVCQRYLPSIVDQTSSIYLSDDDETPDQINCFLSYNWTFRQFTNLQSLSLYNLCSEIVMCKLLAECQHLHNLIRLKFIKSKFKYDNKNIRQLLNNIWTMPKLTYCYLDISFRERGEKYHINFSKISISLQYLTIKNMSRGDIDLDNLFEHTPYLRYFYVDASGRTDITPLYSTMTYIVKLKIDVYESSLILIELLKNMPNLRHLTVNAENIDMNGHQWEEIIVNHVPKLEVFQLKMKFYLNNKDNKKQRAKKLIRSFRSQFWLEERRWFVRCDWAQCQENSCCNYIYLYTLPYAFDYYRFYHSAIKQKSTCPEDHICPSYDQVHTLHYAIFPSENRISSQFTFPNVHRLNFWPPFDDNFSYIVSRCDYLKTLSVGLCQTNYNLNVLYQLQTILDRAPGLYSLEVVYLQSTSMGMPPFELSSKSIRRLDFQDIGEYYNTQQCITLSRSPLGRQCEVLLISVEKRTSIIDLLNKMPNLRAMSVTSKDDPWTNDDDDDDELVNWLKHRLPSTYTITRSSDRITKLQLLKSFQPVRLWLDYSYRKEII